MRVNLNKASEITGLTRQTISKYVKLGKIKGGVVVGNRYLIEEKSLEGLTRHF
jgi:predicted site-specific integrase-resolvase